MRARLKMGSLKFVCCCCVCVFAVNCSFFFFHLIIVFFCWLCLVNGIINQVQVDDQLIINYQGKLEGRTTNVTIFSTLFVPKINKPVLFKGGHYGI